MVIYIAIALPESDSLPNARRVAESRSRQSHTLGTFTESQTLGNDLFVEC